MLDKHGKYKLDDCKCGHKLWGPGCFHLDGGSLDEATRSDLKINYTISGKKKTQNPTNRVKTPKKSTKSEKKHTSRHEIGK